MADKTGVVLFVTFRGMAIAAIVHFHFVPGMALIPYDIFTIYISAVSGYTIFLINRQIIGFVKVTVAGSAIHIAHFYMGDMGKIS